MFNSQTNEKNYISVDTYSKAGPSTLIEYYGTEEGDNLQNLLFAPFKEERDCKNKDIKYMDDIPKNKHGNTRIHLAAKYGQKDHLNAYFNELYDFDAVQRFSILLDINDKNDDGKTPLHLAVEGQHWECTEVLLQEVPELVNVKDNKDRTPLHVLVSSQKTSDEDDIYYNIVWKLLNFPGTDTEVEDKESKSIYDYVKMSNDDTLISLFSQYYKKKKDNMKFKYEKFHNIVEKSESLSRNFNKAAVICGGAAGLSIICNIYLLGFINFFASEKAKYIIEAISDHCSVLSSILPPTALVMQYRSFKHQEKLKKLDDSIELCKTRIEELQNASKDIEHKKTIARLEGENSKALLETKNQLKKELSEMLSEIKGLSRTVSQLVSNSSRGGSCFLETMQHSATNNSSQVTRCAQHQNISKESIASTSVPTNSEKEAEFRSSSAPCGAHFRKAKKENYRLLSKPIYGEKFLEEAQASTTKYSDVFEECSSASTTKLPSEVEFRKKSNENDEPQTFLRSPRSSSAKSSSHSQCTQ